MIMTDNYKNDDINAMIKTMLIKMMITMIIKEAKNQMTCWNCIASNVILLDSATYLLEQQTGTGTRLSFIVMIRGLVIDLADGSDINDNCRWRRIASLGCNNMPVKWTDIMTVSNLHNCPNVLGLSEVINHKCNSSKQWIVRKWMD